MNFILKYLLLVLFLLTFGVVKAQVDLVSKIDQTQLIFKKGSKYFYHGEKLNFQELGPIIESYPEMLEDYRKAVSRNNVKRNSLSVLLSTTAITMGFMVGFHNERDIGELGYLMGGLFYGSIAIISLPIYIINAARSINYSTNSIINRYNARMLNENGYQKSLSYIRLGVTSNGLAIQYHF